MLIKGFSSWIGVVNLTTVTSSSMFYVAISSNWSKSFTYESNSVHPLLTTVINLWTRV